MIVDPSLPLQGCWKEMFGLILAFLLRRLCAFASWGFDRGFRINYARALRLGVLVLETVKAYEWSSHISLYKSNFVRFNTTTVNQVSRLPSLGKWRWISLLYFHSPSFYRAIVPALHLFPLWLWNSVGILRNSFVYITYFIITDRKSVV